MGANQEAALGLTSHLGRDDSGAVPVLIRSIQGN